MRHYSKSQRRAKRRAITTYRYIKRAMGKGDTKTKRGKINIGSYGNARKKLVSKVPVKATGAKKAEAKKPAVKSATKKVVKK
jgi:ribosomal small subunit protein bTHX